MDGPLPLNQAWQMIRGQLEMQMSKPNFDAFVRPLVALEKSDHTIKIGACNSYGRDWAESRLDTTVSRYLSSIYGEEVKVEFVLVEPK